MPNDGKKGITVKIDAEFHAEVRQYLEDHSMTMAEFVTLALTDELHPKNQMEEKNMGNMRTLAFQVPEDLFQRIKNYLRRNNMTQKDFIIGLIEDELERDLQQRESVGEAQDASEELEDTVREDAFELPAEDGAAERESETPDEESESSGMDEDDGESEDEEPSEDETEDESEDEDEDMGFTMGM